MEQDEEKVAFKVNANLRSLVFGTDSALFSFGTTESTLPQETLPAPTPTLFQDLNTQSLFFFHFNRKNTNSVITHGCPLFQRKSDMDHVLNQWEETKQELTLEFKRKHKSAYKRRQKMRKGVSKK